MSESRHRAGASCAEADIHAHLRARRRNAAAPRLACAQLTALKDPFAPTSPATPCTQIYGGPQEALDVGRFRGVNVHARFSMNGGCEIARWQRIRFLFPQT